MINCVAAAYWILAFAGMNANVASLRGLLRGACHRARIRATRWLGMTVMESQPWLFEIRIGELALLSSWTK
ncbi:MAG: hypothetical protein ACJ8E2_08030 [Bradyrhizobium sp.]|jgi:hypothetical protein